MVLSIDQSSVMIAFSVLPDPRKPRNQLYSLVDIISTAILASLCGADDYPTMSDWVEENLEWLQSLGICEEGAPSHDTYERFFRHIDPREFEARFVEWTRLTAGKVSGVLAIDGKTVRGSGGQSTDPIHIVSAFAAENSLVLGQLKTTGKGKELEGFQLLLELLDLKGTTVTINAGGCHKILAKKIIEKKGDYLLHLKGNQGHFYAEAGNFFSQAQEVSLEESGCDYWCSEERSRGRIDKREVWATEELDWLPQKEEWKSLRSIVCVCSTRQTGKEISRERRYYITSHEADAEHLGRAIRSHWLVENKLHWHLDVTFREDKSRVREGHGPENLSVLRRASLNILRNDKSSKQSLKRRRLKAGWNRDYLMKLIIK